MNQIGLRSRARRAELPMVALLIMLPATVAAGAAPEAIRPKNERLAPLRLPDFLES